MSGYSCLWSSTKKALDKKNKSGKKRDQSGVRKKKQATSQDKSIQQFYDSLTYQYKSVEGVDMVEVHVDVA